MVGDHPVRGLLDVELELVVVGLNLGLDRRHDLLNQLRQIDRLGVDVHSTGFDFGEIEHIVDHREQVIAGGLNREQVLERSRTRLAVLFLKLLTYELRVPDDGRERCPQLMAHVGEERGLRLARLERLISRPSHLELGLLSVRDVLGADDVANTLLIRGLGGRDFERDPAAVSATTPHLSAAFEPEREILCRSRGSIRFAGSLSDQV